MKAAAPHRQVRARIVGPRPPVPQSRLARWNLSAPAGSPLIRAWTDVLPRPHACIALPGTAYETAALAHRIAATFLTLDPTRWNAWPSVLREQTCVVVRIVTETDGALEGLLDAVMLEAVTGGGRNVPMYRIEVRP